MRDEPVIKITEPEIQHIQTETFNDGLVGIDVYDYDNSHVIYKGVDLGSFKEISNYIDMINSLSSRIDHLENDYYHALSILFNDEKLTKRKKKCLEEDYEDMKIIRFYKIQEKVDR